MKWFYDRKISTKLYLCFGFIGLIALAIGWMSYSNARRMAALADDMFSNQTSAIVQLANVRTGFLDMRMARRVAVTMNDAGERQRQIQKAGEHESRMKEALRLYLATRLVPEESVIAPRLQSELEEYYRLVHESDTYLLQMNDRKVLEIYNGPLPPVAAAITTDIDRLVTVSESVANDHNQQNAAIAESTTRQIVIYVAAGMLAAVLLGTFLARLIGNALKKLQSAADKLAVGDVEVQVDIDSADEIGTLARSFRTMAENIRQHALAAQAIAAGNLNMTVQCWSDKDVLGKSLQMCASNIKALLDNAIKLSDSLSEAASELSRVAAEMGSSAEQTASQANMVSAGSEQVSRNIQTVATAADEMGASIREIAKSTADATKVATAAVRSAEDTNVTIGKLGQSSAEIGQVIKVITSIAQQTNLLALNATIEAARAGEAGKGFAVVANEVKELAKETAKATEDISRKIEAIQTDTKGAVAAIEQIGSVIGQINDIQNTVASAVEEQSVTTNEITRNLTEAAKGGADISRSIAGVAEAARTTTGGAGQTQKSAESLEKLAEELQALMGRFRYDSGTARVNSVVAGRARNFHHELAGASIQ